MNEAEIYFARENFIWNLSIYFMLALVGIVIIGYIYAVIYDFIKKLIKNKLTEMDSLFTQIENLTENSHLIEKQIGKTLYELEYTLYSHKRIYTLQTSIKSYNEALLKQTIKAMETIWLGGY